VITAPPPPTPVEGMPLIPALAPSARSGTEVRERTQPESLPAPRAWRRIGSMLALLVAAVLAAAGLTMAVRVRIAEAPPLPSPLRFAPTMVLATIRLEGALVRGASRDWALDGKSRARLGDPVPVQLTAYCLQGTTRRDRYVRQGIVAADPRVFPLGRFVEVYVGRVYYGRFLVDDTGKAIRDAILDIWTPTCRDARLFGRQRGTAVLVPRPRGAMKDTLLTGRLGGVAER
jgi:3D (Asp-Asp-Asp) domain-containing protein